MEASISTIEAIKMMTTGMLGPTQNITTLWNHRGRSAISTSVFLSRVRLADEGRHLDGENIPPNWPLTPVSPQGHTTNACTLSLDPWPPTAPGLSRVIIDPSGV